MKWARGNWHANFVISATRNFCRSGSVTILVRINKLKQLRVSGIWPTSRFKRLSINNLVVDKRFVDIQTNIMKWCEVNMRIAQRWPIMGPIPYIIGLKGKGEHTCRRKNWIFWSLLWTNDRRSKCGLQLQVKDSNGVYSYEKHWPGVVPEEEGGLQPAWEETRSWREKKPNDNWSKILKRVRRFLTSYN